MLLIIFLALILLFVQSLLPANFLVEQAGPEAQMKMPVNLPEPTPKLVRSRNALRNMLETLPIFLTLAVLTIVLGAQVWLSILGGVLYLVGRVVHVVSHVGALSPFRTIGYGVALTGMILLAIPLLGYI